jgi:hypothetical protein
LKAYRDRLAGETATAEPDATTPAGTTFKWPGGNVYYRFDPTQVGNGTIDALKMQQFRDGVAEWAAFANLHFIENITGQPHYITVQEDPALGGGFSSSVGMMHSGHGKGRARADQSSHRLWRRPCSCRRPDPR